MEHKRRRSPGEGSVYFVKAKGVWCAQMEVGKPGIRRKRRFFGKSREEALAKLQILQARDPRSRRIEARKDGARKGIVYFIAAENSIKIGFTTNLTQRMRLLRTACPVPLRLLGTHEGSVHTERAFHRLFAHLRMEGEWFRSTPSLEKIIAAYCEDDSSDVAARKSASSASAA